MKKKVRCLTATVRLYGKEQPDGRLLFSGAVELREVLPGECEGVELIPAAKQKADIFLRGFMKRPRRA